MNSMDLFFFCSFLLHSQLINKHFYMPSNENVHKLKVSETDSKTLRQKSNCQNFHFTATKNVKRRRRTKKK